MASERIFQGTLVYLKLVTIFGAGFCLLSMFFIQFDPWHYLDTMIWNDIYENPKLPDVVKPAFNFLFLLFSWLSVLTMILIFLITKYALAKKEKWAFWAIILIGFFWPLGGTIITYYTHAWSYFISVGVMTLLFFPPIILLYPHVHNK